MKLSFHNALAALLLTSTSIAAPLPSDGEVVYDALGVTLRPRSPLERRDDSVCSNILTVAQQIGTSKGVMVWASSTLTGYYSALAVCKEIRKDDANCDNIARAIAGAITTVFASVNYNYGGAADPVQDRDVKSLATYMHKSLTADGHTFAGIEDVTQHMLGQYGPDERKPNQVTRITGFTHASSNHTGNYDVYDFGNGDGHVHIPAATQSQSSDTLAKRVDGAGFKISFTKRLGSLLTAAHKADMANAIATYWHNWAQGTVRSQGYTYYNKDLIGFVETGHTSNFYFRIIPETGGFGLNYESVDVCGQMGAYL